MEKEYLIKKWLSDELSPEERIAFEKLADSRQMEQIVSSARHFNASELSKVEDFETLNSRLVSKEPPTRKFSWTKVSLRIAATLLVAFGLYYFLLNEPALEIQTLAGEKTTILLPDASTVVLNAGSSLKYKTKGWDNDRLVELAGEAYFKVAKGSAFRVQTEMGEVSVLGTQFNVRQREQYFGIDCFEGRVMVRMDSMEEVLTAGTYLRKSIGNISRGQLFHTFPSWTENRSVFEMVPLFEVLDEVERQYGIQINLLAIPGETLFTGGFPHDNLENALEAITVPLGLGYTKENSEHFTLFVSE